jgi:hypothetical protein
MVTVVTFWGALFDERSGMSFACQSLQYLVVCQYIHKYSSVGPGSVQQFMPY